MSLSSGLICAGVEDAERSVADLQRVPVDGTVFLLRRRKGLLQKRADLIDLVRLGFETSEKCLAFGGYTVGRAREKDMCAPNHTLATYPASTVAIVYIFMRAA